MPRNFPRDPSHQPVRDPGEGAPPDPGGGKGREGEVRQKPQLPPQATNPSTEPRGERGGKHSSQGLTGSQGSGGGADRGVNQPAPRTRSPRGKASSSDDDNSGIDVA
jgi:hypothetical protein